MNENPPSVRSAFIAAAASVALHALLGLVFVVVMIYVVPRYKITFVHLGVGLPWLTTAVVSVSDWFVSYWYVAGFVVLPFLALDGGIVFLCWQRHGTRTLGITWVIMLIVLWLLMMAFITLGIWLAMLKLQQGIAR